MRASSLHPNQTDNQACPKCGALAGFARREQGPHVGEYCIACEKWQRWVPRREDRCPKLGTALKLVEPTSPKNTGHPWGDPPAKVSPPKYSPRQLAHPQNVDEKIAAIEHDIGIIAQILIGGRHE